MAPSANTRHITCAVARSYDDDLVCAAPATQMASASCVHEHVTTAGVCDSCLDWLRRQRMVCVTCDELSERPHLCGSVLVEVRSLRQVSARA